MSHRCTLVDVLSYLFAETWKQAVVVCSIEAIKINDYGIQRITYVHGTCCICAASPPKHYFQTICTPMQRQHALPTRDTHTYTYGSREQFPIPFT